LARGPVARGTERSYRRSTRQALGADHGGGVYTRPRWTST
jgi:hypothetical protein